MFIFSNSQEKFSLVLLCISQFQLHPVPQGGAFANFALPEGRGICQPQPQHWAQLELTDVLQMTNNYLFRP